MGIVYRLARLVQCPHCKFVWTEDVAPWTVEYPCPKCRRAMRHHVITFFLAVQAIREEVEVKIVARRGKRRWTSTSS